MLLMEIFSSYANLSLSKFQYFTTMKRLQEESFLESVSHGKDFIVQEMVLQERYCQDNVDDGLGLFTNH